MLSLGCENLTHEQFLAELGDYDHDRVKFLTCQDVEDELVAGREILKELAAYAAQFKREPIPASELVVGMKCGGSDGLSGITANPTIGRFSDMLCSRGGSTVLTEVPEMFGAEGFLMDRCQNEQVFEKAVRMINGFKEYFISHNEVSTTTRARATSRAASRRWRTSPAAACRKAAPRRSWMSSTTASPSPPRA